MDTPLFRQEVIQARQAQWVGAAHQVQPPRAAWASAFALLISAAVAALFIWGEWQRKVTVQGVLVPPGGLVQLSAPQAGVIARWLVSEGAEVSQGQPLVEIHSERHTSAGEAGAMVLGTLAQRRSSLEAELRWAEQQASQRRRTLSDRLESLQAEERQAKTDALHAQQRVQLATQTQQRYVELARSGFVSDMQAQQKREDLLEQQAREGVAQRAIQGLRRERQAVRADLDGHEEASAAAQEPLRRALATLAQEEAEHRSRMSGAVVAPRSGRIGSIVQPVGQSVVPGQILGHLVALSPGGGTTGEHGRLGGSGEFISRTPDRASMEAVLFAPTRSAGFVRAGQTVWIRVQAYPYQKFGMLRGQVSRVNDAPVTPQELSPAQAAAVHGGPADALVRIVVVLERAQIEGYGQTWPLKAGSILEADIVQDSRPIWEWVFEPLLAAGQRAHALGGPAAKQ